MTDRRAVLIEDMSDEDYKGMMEGLRNSKAPPELDRLMDEDDTASALTAALSDIAHANRIEMNSLYQVMFELVKNLREAGISDKVIVEAVANGVKARWENWVDGPVQSIKPHELQRILTEKVG